MKKFENLKMVLFDSTKASFKLTVEAQFTRGNREQGYRDLVYVTDRYTGLLNPNIYLTLAYKDENVNPVYTSYPQLFRLREAFEKIKDYVVDENVGFMRLEDNQLMVRPEYTEPVVLSNIGKNNNWISLKLSVIQTEENGIITSAPGVTIELSTANRYASPLSVEEFLTVYTIIKDLNLANIQCMMSLAFLDTERGQYGQPQVYQQPQYQAAPQPVVYYNQQPQQPRYNQQPQYQQGGYNNNNGQYTRPNYNTNARRTSVPVAPAAPAPQSYQQPQYEEDTMMRPQPQVTKSNTLPPRSTGKTQTPVMTLGAVESTPIEEISYNDPNSIDELFN